MDSLELGFDTSSSVRATLTAATSSPHGGPECPSGTTYELWVSHQRRELRQMDVCPSLAEPGSGFTQTPFLVERTYEVLAWNHHRTHNNPGECIPGFVAQPYVAPLSTNKPDTLLTFSAAVSPARTSPSPAAEQDSPGNAPASSTSSPESSTLFDPDGFSSRTYPGCSPRTAVGTSESSLERWPTSGTAWAGGFSTHVSSECRSAAGVCSSSEPALTEILQPPQDVPARYSLSARAARGILRRAEKRGRTLPSHLSQALEQVARTTTTDRRTA
jgi:hypothetical protein